MKKFFTLLFLILFGSYAVAEEVNKTSETQASIKKINSKAEKVKSAAAGKAKEEKKQLTSVQKRKLAKKQASKLNKILKKKTKEENLINIHTKHLEYKKTQLEEFSEKKANNVVDNTNTETKEQENEE